MIELINKLPEKYEVDFNDVKYPYGAMNLIYSLKKNELVARVSKNQEDVSFTLSLTLHERDLSKKLEQKGYPVPKVYGAYNLFHKNLKTHIPGLVMEDKYDFMMLKNVPSMFYPYFNDFYEEILKNAEKEGFVVGDRNEGNFLCNLKTREGCLIDFEDWDYNGKGKKILSPKWSSFYNN